MTEGGEFQKAAGAGKTLPRRLRYRDGMSSETRHQRAAFLGIERSLTGRRWAERLGDERIALAMAQRHGLPDAICRLLAAREVDLEGVPDFLEPTLRKFLPDPSHLKDMDVAVARLVRAVQQGERIVVFGDYDVDGATSSALLLRFFRAIGGNIGVYIPDRRKEGYGPNAPALLKLARRARRSSSRSIAASPPTSRSPRRARPGSTSS